MTNWCWKSLLSWTQMMSFDAFNHTSLFLDVLGLNYKIDLFIAQHWTVPFIPLLGIKLFSTKQLLTRIKYSYNVSNSCQLISNNSIKLSIKMTWTRSSPALYCWHGWPLRFAPIFVGLPISGAESQLVTILRGRDLAGDSLIWAPHSRKVLE